MNVICAPMRCGRRDGHAGACACVTKGAPANTVTNEMHRIRATSRSGGCTTAS